LYENAPDAPYGGSLAEAAIPGQMTWRQTQGYPFGRFPEEAERDGYDEQHLAREDLRRIDGDAET
jgi:hypothetical protein